MVVANLIYGLSSVRTRFVNFINQGRNWEQLGLSRENIPILVDQLVPNTKEKAQQEVMRKREIMMRVTRSWWTGKSPQEIDAFKNILISIQETLTTKLIEQSKGYIPHTDDYSLWESSRAQRSGENCFTSNGVRRFSPKQNDFFSRKCKRGLQMPSRSENKGLFGKTIFLLNGLDMASVVLKNPNTRDIITFRELRSVYRNVLRVGESASPIFMGALTTKKGDEFHIVPPPWHASRFVDLTETQAQYLGIPISEKDRSPHLNGLYVIRGNELWSHYEPGREPKSKPNPFGLITK